MSAGRTHRECANYSNGYCRLFNVRVDPNGPACPNFRPRQAVGEAQVQASHWPAGRASPPPLTIGNSMGWRHRRRRRFRHGRGWLSRLLR